jgi:hypothetical protein
MSEVRPSGDTDGAARLAASARDRLAFALADLGLPDDYRLSEWQRATVSALLERLVDAVEAELRGALAGSFADVSALHASLASASVEIAMPILDSAAPWEPALLGVLLRRAEEHRLARGAADHGLLIDLAGDGDEAIGGDAMSLLIAQSSRVDAFQEPLMLRGELPAELQHVLVWTVAAALRRYMITSHDVAPADADAAIALAASALLAGSDEGEGFAARSLRLMRRLAALRRLDDAMVVRSLADGSLPLFLAAVSVRSGLGTEPAWELLSDASGRGGALLLRAAGVTKEAAGAILFRLHGESPAVADEIGRFEAVDAAAALRLLGLWQADPAYRAAVARMVG